MSVRTYGSNLINIWLKMTEILALPQTAPCHHLAPVSPTVCLMLIQLRAKKKYIVKSAGVDPSGLKKWRDQDTPEPPVGKSCLSARDGWYDHHQMIQPLLPAIFLDTTLG